MNGLGRKICFLFDNNRTTTYVQLCVTATENTDETTALSPIRATQILNWLREEKYGTFDHVLMILLWHVGLREKGLRALDLEHYDGENKRLSIRHQAETGTPLRSMGRGERVVPLLEETCDVLDTYIAKHRHDVTDKYGRKPLLTTKQGRPSRSTFLRHARYITQPCQYTGDCPHGKELDSCEARGYHEYSDGCPSMHTPYEIRMGMVQHWKSDEFRSKVVGMRADESSTSRIFSYDLTEEERADKRRMYIEKGSAKRGKNGQLEMSKPRKSSNIDLDDEQRESAENIAASDFELAPIAEFLCHLDDLDDEDSDGDTEE